MFRNDMSGINGMKLTEIVRVDSRGRISIPSSIRNGLNFSEGTYIMLLAEIDSRRAQMIPFAHSGAKLVEFQINFGDVPGILARVAAKLAELGVDLLSSQSRTLKRGEFAEWYGIADISNCKFRLEQINKHLKKVHSIKSIKFKVLENI